MTLQALVLQGLSTPYHSGVPLDLITGTGVVPRPRLRVDPADTAFFEGRQFRTYHEFNLASGSVWLKFVSPIDFIVKSRVLSIVQGNIRFAVSTGGTESGTWTAKNTFPVNAMANRPAYTQQILVSTGGTVTGSSERDVQLLETGTSQAASVESQAAESGYEAGTYYVEIRHTGGTARGVYSVIWEEYQPRSPEVY